MRLRVILIMKWANGVSMLEGVNGHNRAIETGISILYRSCLHVFYPWLVLEFVPCLKLSCFCDEVGQWCHFKWYSLQVLKLFFQSRTFHFCGSVSVVICGWGSNGPNALCWFFFFFYFKVGIGGGDYYVNLSFL